MGIAETAVGVRIRKASGSVDAIGVSMPLSPGRLGERASAVSGEEPARLATAR
jgi:hypothetical protein